jgi:hypothetical protein
MKKQVYETINFLAAIFVITIIALLTAYLVSNKIDDINGKKEQTEFKESNLPTCVVLSTGNGSDELLN